MLTGTGAGEGPGEVWPENTGLSSKVYGNLGELQKTAAFIVAAGVEALPSERMRRRHGSHWRSLPGVYSISFGWPTTINIKWDIVYLVSAVNQLYNSFKIVFYCFIFKGEKPIPKP